MNIFFKCIISMMKHLNFVDVVHYTIGLPVGTTDFIRLWNLRDVSIFFHRLAYFHTFFYLITQYTVHFRSLYEKLCLQLDGQ